MSKKRLVTSNHKPIRTMANAKAVNHTQIKAAQGDGTIVRFHDNLKVDATALAPPPGSHLHIIRIRFKPDREWQEAVDSAGPDTPSDYNVRKVGDLVWKVGGLYPPVITEEIEEDLILLNYPNGEGFDTALAWARSRQLQNTVPREVFAIAEQYGMLHKEFGHDPMYIASTEECIMEDHRIACNVWWRGTQRGAALNMVERFIKPFGWFAFRR